jgi:hypothetical protein
MSIANNPKLFAVVPRSAPRPAAAPKHTSLADARASRQAESDLKEAIDRAASLLDRLDERAEACAAQIAYWQKRKAFAENRSERLEEEILTRMDAANLSVAPGIRRQLTASICPASLQVLDQKLIPPEYMRSPKAPASAPDKNAIKAAFAQNDELVPANWGCRLVSQISLVRK